MNKSSSQSHTQTISEHKQSRIISDISAFLAIVSGYLFVSLTFRFSILEESFDLSLKSKQDLTIIFLAYVLVLGGLKLLSRIIRLKKSHFSQCVQNEIRRSLLMFHAITCLYLVTAVVGAKICFHLLGHILLWVVIAQFNQIFCEIFKSNQVLSSFANFGRTIQIILISGQVIRLFGIDFCDFI